MQQLFNELIKQDVKPFLARYGFSKRGLNFSNSAEDLIYIFNFQKSSGNSADNVMFYVNCGIYSEELARLQSKEPLTAPLEANCHFRARIEEIAESAPDRYAITPDADMGAIRTSLLSGLEEVIRFYEAMTGARSIVDYYTAGPSLHLGEESFRLLLQSKEQAAHVLFPEFRARLKYRFAMKLLRPAYKSLGYG